MAQPFDVAYTGAERSIFITRSPKRLRYIENGAEIEQLCREAGLEIVDFDELTLPEQIRTLANARYVVGIHGAGLVNMLFRAGRPMSLLEIFPPGEYYPFHYMLMARQLDYWYDGMIGKSARQAYSGGFYVEPIELRQRIAALLAA
jgi:capsular polysaccharide biosynthesis protein